VRPLTAWAVVGPRGNIDSSSISHYRAFAIQKYERLTGDSWAICRKQGYRAVKVRIEKVDA